MAVVYDLSCLPCCNKGCCGGHAALGDELWADIEFPAEQCSCSGTKTVKLTYDPDTQDWRTEEEICGVSPGLPPGFVVHCNNGEWSLTHSIDITTAASSVRCDPLEIVFTTSSWPDCTSAMVTVRL